jgi:beta-D-xylosidase 4|eukprot:COSAG06_NODE_4632_length_4083_cov_5.096637_1_plen_1020_part_00
MLAVVALAVTVAAGAADGGSSYHLKLWGCSSDDPSKATYKNQRFILNSTAHTIEFAYTNGCLTSSSTRKAAPGSQLHISPCTPACSLEQGWRFDSSTGYLKSTTMDGVCIGVAPQSDPEAEVVVTAQRCDAKNVDLKWQYSEALGHLEMNGKCIDAGRGVVSKPGLATTSGRVPPSGQGCLTSVAKALPYCDSSLPIASRVADIISRMTIAEKTAHLWGSGSHGDNTTFPGVPRIGLPPFDWGLEGLHGLRIGCYPVPDPETCVDPNFPAPGTFACPTVFPAPTGLGATFNDSLIHDIGVVIGTEARALNNMGSQSAGRLIVRTPELNLIRDPRWGRNVENPTEDPMHAGKYGAAMVNGVQSKVDGVMLAGVEMKHYAVYQVEDCGAVPQGHGPGIPTGLPACSRMKFDANISAAELNESYLPAFRETVQTSDPTGVMCSYNAVNGVPACANKLLADTIRGWGFTGYTGTDCSAADGIFDNHNYAEDTAHGYAVGLNSGGYDLICNPHNYTALTEAVSNQLVTSAALDRALTNAFTVLMKVGMFSPLDSSAVFKIGMEKLGSPSHMDLALQAARQSTVLLRNVKKQGRAALPLAQPANGTHIAVIGPQANATGQLGGNYFNSECASGTVVWTVAAGGGGQLSSWPCVPTLVQAVKTVAGDAATVTYTKGCEQRCSGTDTGDANVSTKVSEYAPNVCNAADRAGIPPAVAAAKDAEVVVLGLGYDTAIAGEGHDRLDMALPGAQEELALSVLRAVSPSTTVVLVLYAGASISIDALLEAARQPDAIIVGHMPGVTGGTAVAEALFGKHNDFGRLPYTVYPHAYQNTTQFTEMSLRKGKHTPEGRTYKFYSGTPQFKYGEGLSFTEFALGNTSRADGDRMLPQAKPDHVLRAADASAEIMIAVSLQNVGVERAGSTVVMAWFAPAAEATGLNHRDSLAARLGQDPPIRSLVAYMRTHSLAVGETAVVKLKLRVDDLAFVDARTSQRMLPAGEYEVRVDLGPSATSAGEVVHSVHVASDVVL